MDQQVAPPYILGHSVYDSVENAHRDWPDIADREVKVIDPLCRVPGLCIAEGDYTGDALGITFDQMVPILQRTNEESIPNLGHQYPPFLHGGIREASTGLKVAG